jgi:rhodanese-related sulfurtransferase
MLNHPAYVTLATIAALAIPLLARAADGKSDAKGEQHEKPAAPNGFKNVKPDEFEKLSKQPDAVVLDVRTPEEYAAGHIPHSVNIDYKSADFDKKVASLDKNKTYLVHCAGGGRSSAACKKLSNVSFPHLYNLDGGIRAWEKAGKPVEK